MSVKNTLCAGFTPSCPILRHDVKIFSSPSPSGIAIALRPIASPLFVPRFAARNTPAAFLLCGFPPAGRVVRTVTTPFSLFSLLLLFVFKVLLPARHLATDDDLFFRRPAEEAAAAVVLNDFGSRVLAADAATESIMVCGRPQ